MLPTRKLLKFGTCAILLSTCIVSYLSFRIFTFQLFTGTALKPCKLEKLDPWDKSLTPYLVSPPPLQCAAKKQLMYVDMNGRLNFNKTSLKYYALDETKLICVTRALNRVLGDSEVTFEARVEVTLPVFVKSHVFRVTCTDESKNDIYDYLHFNPMWNSDAKPKDTVEDESSDNLSIIVFGIDSVSRSHALRNLPKSYQFLRKEFRAYDFEGYSKVGENTWPNLVPLLTGKNHRDFPLVLHLRKHADSMPLLWKESAIDHIASYFAEDRPDISTFNYIKSGFKFQPTDFYFRPYTLGMHTFEAKIMEPLGKPTWDCYGVSNYFDIQIEYLKGFLTYYAGKRKMAYFWNNQVCHEDFTTLSRGDESFLEFLKWMKDTGQTKNAIFITLSDHGYRIGGASLTHVGRAENNKPWLMLHVPEHILQKYPWLHETLVENSKKLVTHYDTYQTMLDILNNNAFVKQPHVEVQTNLVRRNIFFPIPDLRTCADAGIEEKYCTCEDKQNVSTTTDLAKSLAEFIVSEINEILSKHRNSCEILTLKDITEVSVTYSNSDQENLPEDEHNSFLYSLFKTPVQDFTGRYFILFHTLPGNGYFEGTVDYSKYLYRGSNQHIKLIGDPSRLDRYGNQSACMTDSFLRSYCYCKDFKPSR
ncbi:hypothetical protein ACF0H5_004131 [Mactra antiquata]